MLTGRDLRHRVGQREVGPRVGSQCGEGVPGAFCPAASPHERLVHAERVRFTDAHAEFESLPCQFLGGGELPSQHGERRPPGQRPVPCSRVPQLLSCAAVPLQFQDTLGIAEFDVRRRPEQPRLDDHVAVSGVRCGDEHLLDHRQPALGRARLPARIVEGKEAERQRARIIHLTGVGHRFRCEGRRSALARGVPRVVQIPGQRGEHPRPQNRRRLRQNSGGLVQQRYGFGMAVAPPEGMRRDRGPGQPGWIGAAAREVGRVTKRPVGRRRVAGLIAGSTQCEQQIDPRARLDVACQIERGQSPLIVPARLLEGATSGGLGTGEGAVVHRLGGRCRNGGAEMGGQLRGVDTSPFRVQGLQRTPDCEMQSNALLGRQAREQGLPEQVVREPVHRRSSSGRLGEHTGDDGLLEQRRQWTGFVCHLHQDLEWHLRPDDSEHGQQVDTALRQASEPSFENVADTVEQGRRQPGRRRGELALCHQQPGRPRRRLRALEGLRSR